MPNSQAVDNSIRVEAAIEPRKRSCAPLPRPAPPLYAMRYTALTWDVDVEQGRPDRWGRDGYAGEAPGDIVPVHAVPAAAVADADLLDGDAELVEKFTQRAVVAVGPVGVVPEGAVELGQVDAEPAADDGEQQHEVGLAPRGRPGR